MYIGEEYGSRALKEYKRGCRILHDAIRRRSAAAAADLVNRAVRERDYEQVPARPGLDVRDDAEVSAEEQALAFRQVTLRQVVCDKVAQSRIVYGYFSAIAGEVEMKQRAAFRRG